MTVALPASPPGQVQRRHEWPLVVLGAAGIFMMVANSRVRSLEAQAAGRLAGLVASGPTYVWGARHSFYWDLGRSTATGLTATTECTSAFTLGPLLIAAGILFTWRRPPLPRMRKPSASPPPSPSPATWPA